MEKIIEPRTYEWVKENMRKANERYRSSNRERLNQKQKEYYDSHKADEEYMQKRRKRHLIIIIEKKPKRQNK